LESTPIRRSKALRLWSATVRQRVEEMLGAVIPNGTDTLRVKIEAFGGEVTSTVTMATALAPDFKTVPGQQMFAALQQLRLA
jgi:hypothetical protein